MLKRLDVTTSRLGYIRVAGTRPFTVLLILVMYNTYCMGAGFPEAAVAQKLRDARKLVTVDLSDLKPGSYRTIPFNDNAVLVYHRTSQDLVQLRSGRTDRLANPSSQNFKAIIEDQYSSSTAIVWARLFLVTQPVLEKTRFRSWQDQYFITVKHSPLGCNLIRTDTQTSAAAIFMDVCNGLTYDSAGRVLKNSWTPPKVRDQRLPRANLFIPPHLFRSPTQLVLGVPSATPIPEINATAIRARYYSRMSLPERLLYAAAFNDMEMVKKCLAKGVSINQLSGQSRPVDGAALGGSRALIEFMLARGALPTLASIETARLTGRKEVQKLLERERQKYPDSK